MVNFDGAYFESCYHAEIARKDKLRAQASVPLGIAFIAASTISLAAEETTSWAGLSLLGLSALALLAFAISLCRFYFVKPDDPRVPYLDDLKKHRDSLQAEDNLDAAMAAQLDKYHFDGANYNARENDRRARHLFRMNQSVAVALVAAVIAAAIPVTQELLVNTKVIPNVRRIDAPAPAPAPAAASPTGSSADADGEAFQRREFKKVDS